MTVTDKYWWNVNKKSCIISFIIVFLSTVVMRGVMTGFGVLIAIITIISCATRFLNLNAPIYNETDSLNQLLIMPFSREQIYRSFIRNMFIQALVIVVLVLIGTSLDATIFFNNASIMTGDVPSNSRLYIWTDFIKESSIILLFLGFLIGLINSYTLMRKSTIFGALIAISFLSGTEGLVFSQPVNEKIFGFTISLLQLFGLFTNLIICAVLIYALIRLIKTNYNQFVLHKYKVPIFLRLSMLKYRRR